MSTDQPKVTTSVALPPDLRDRLDVVAAEEDRSRSYLTAQAIREMLQRREAMRRGE